MKTNADFLPVTETMHSETGEIITERCKEELDQK